MKGLESELAALASEQAEMDKTHHKNHAEFVQELVLVVGFVSFVVGSGGKELQRTITMGDCYHVTKFEQLEN